MNKSNLMTVALTAIRKTLLRQSLTEKLIEIGLMLLNKSEKRAR